MASLQFLRNYRITVIDPTPTEEQLAHPSIADLPEVSGKARGLILQSAEPNLEPSQHGGLSDKGDGLQITFKVDGKSGENLNTLTLKIYNLTEASQNMINENSSLKLEIWYGNNQPTTLFQGDVSSSFTAQKGADMITTTVVGDGYKAISTIGAIQSASYPAGTTIRTIVLDMIAMLGYDEGNLEGLPPATDPVDGNAAFSCSVIGWSKSIDSTIEKAYSFAGNTKTALNDILTSNGLAYNIEKNALYVWPFGGGREGISIIVDADTGLIGSPKIKTSKSADTSSQDKSITFQTLLNPLLTVGSQVKVIGDTLKHDCSITKVTHQGDYMGKSWVTKAEGTIGIPATKKKTTDD